MNFDGGKCNLLRITGWSRLFVYSNTSSDYHHIGDKSTANDAYTFLVNWLERFPQYKTRDFYITGERYAGHYVPQLAYTVLINNKNANQALINLKGIAVCSNMKSILLLGFLMIESKCVDLELILGWEWSDWWSYRQFGPIRLFMDTCFEFRWNQQRNPYLLPPF